MRLRKSIKTNRYLQLSAGLCTIALALYLATVHRFAEFYLILLVGDLLALKAVHALIKAPLLGKKQDMIILFLAFVAVGLAFDVVFGLWWTRLWSYPAYSTLDYVRLYLLVYPLGGFVMLYSFVIGVKIAGIEGAQVSPVSQRLTAGIPICIIIAGGVGVGAGLFIVGEAWGPMIIASSIVASSYGCILLLSERLRKDTMLRALIGSPLRCGLVILITAYAQGLLHEWPNVYAKEWIYHNWPLQNLQVLGIPATVLFCGWIALAIIPYSIWELCAAPNPRCRSAHFAC